MAEKAQILLDIEAQGAATTLGQLQDRSEKLAEALEQATFGTDNWKALKQEMIATNREVKNLELSFEALDSEQVASEVGSVAGAIGDVATSMVLLSGGNETLEEMAQNIETALGVSMALKGSIEGVQSARKLWNDAIARGNTLSKIAIGLQQGMTKALNMALGVWGLIAVAIVAVVAALKRWAESASVAEQAQKALNEAQLAGARAAGEEEAQLKILAGTLMDATASTDARKDALERLNEVIPDTIGFITEETIATGEAVAVIQKYIESVKVRAELAALEASFQDQVAKRIEKETELRLAGADANSMAGDMIKNSIEVMKQGEDVILQQINNLQKQISATEDSGDALEKTNIELEKNNRFTEESTEKTEKNTEAIEENNQAIIDKSEILAEVEKLENEYLDSKLSKEEQELNAVQDKYFRIIEEAKKNKIDTTLLEEAREQELAEIRLRYFEEQVLKELEEDWALLELEKEFEAEKTRIAEEEQAKRDADRERSIELAKQGAQDLLNATEKLANFQSKKELQRAKEKVARGEKLTQAEIKRLERQDKINKAFALAQIAADTARGVSGAIAAGAGIPFPANLGAIASGVAAVLSGAVQAAQVLGEAPDIPTVDTSAGVFDETTDNAQGTPNVNDFNSGSTLLNQPNKVYVVESEITETQNNVAVIESQASFG